MSVRAAESSSGVDALHDAAKPLHRQFKWTIVQTTIALMAGEFVASGFLPTAVAEKLNLLWMAQGTIAAIGLGANWGIAHSAIGKEKATAVLDAAPSAGAAVTAEVKA